MEGSDTQVPNVYTYQTDYVPMPVSKQSRNVPNAGTNKQKPAPLGATVNAPRVDAAACLVASNRDKTEQLKLEADIAEISEISKEIAESAAWKRRKANWQLHHSRDLPLPPGYPKQLKVSFYTHKEGAEAVSQGALPNKGKTAPAGPLDCLSGVTFTISGVMDSMARDEAEAFIKRHGGDVSSGSRPTRETYAPVSDATT